MLWLNGITEDIYFALYQIKEVEPFMTIQGFFIYYHGTEDHFKRNTRKD